MIAQEAYLTIDLHFSAYGDFKLQGGDFVTTVGTEGGAVIQEIQDRVKSYPGDWLIMPRRGCLMSDFAGEPNNAETHSEIESAIKTALSYDRFLVGNDFEVLVAPVSRSQIGIRLDLVSPIGSEYLRSTKTIKIIYDLDGDGPYIGRG